MSESNDIVSPMEQFNINELAGATAIILTGISGILVVIFKSRCFCKFRVGISDKYSICMCERKPPPDPKEEDSEEETNDKDKDKDKDVDKKKDEDKDENLIPPKKNNNNNINVEIDKLV